MCACVPMLSRRSCSESQGFSPVGCLFLTLAKEQHLQKLRMLFDKIGHHDVGGITFPMMPGGTHVRRA